MRTPIVSAIVLFLAFALPAHRGAASQHITDEDRASVLAVLSELQIYAREGNTERIEGLMAERLRQSFSKREVSMPDGTSYRVLAQDWFDKHRQRMLANVSTGVSVDVLDQYPGSPTVWEVVLRHSNEAYEMVALWYFVREDGVLKICDAPSQFIPCPPGFKSFNLAPDR